MAELVSDDGTCLVLAEERQQRRAERQHAASSDEAEQSACLARAGIDLVVESHLHPAADVELHLEVVERGVQLGGILLPDALAAVAISGPHHPGQKDDGDRGQCVDDGVVDEQHADCGRRRDRGRAHECQNRIAGKRQQRQPHAVEPRARCCGSLEALEFFGGQAVEGRSASVRCERCDERRRLAGPERLRPRGRFQENRPKDLSPIVGLAATIGSRGMLLVELSRPERPGISREARVRDQRATGISEPVNRTGPDGCPVVEPPLGSRLTASPALASASAVSCGRKRAVVVPGRSLGKIPSRAALAVRGHQPDLEHVGGEIAGRREVEPQHQTPVGSVEIRRHHRPLILVEQHRHVRGPGGHRIDPGREAGQAVAESGDVAGHARQAPGCALDACEPLVERRDLVRRHMRGEESDVDDQGRRRGRCQSRRGAPEAEAVPQPIEPAFAHRRRCRRRDLPGDFVPDMRPRFHGREPTRRGD